MPFLPPEPSLWGPQRGPQMSPGESWGPRPGGASRASRAQSRVPATSRRPGTFPDVPETPFSNGDPPYFDFPMEIWDMTPSRLRATAPYMSRSSTGVSEIGQRSTRGVPAEYRGSTRGVPNGSTTQAHAHQGSTSGVPAECQKSASEVPSGVGCIPGPPAPD